MAEYLPITEARDQLLRLAPVEDEEIVVTRNGRPVFSIVSHDLVARYRRLDSLVETAEILADKAFMERLRQGIAEADRGETISLEEAERELDALEEQGL
jgi:prevent-host-death family protein